jgi:hypothetical protein
VLSIHAEHSCCGVLLQVEALDLNPGVAKIDPTTRKMFEEFKAKEAESKKKQM